MAVMGPPPTSVKAVGSPAIFGAIVLSGDGITLDQSGKQITFTSTGGGGGGSHDILDGSTHTDSVADAVSRGSIIYGNSTPKWDELIVGAANSVLWTDGTDVSWSNAPQLANIADTGGTARITTSTSSPEVTLTGDAVVTGKFGSSIGANIQYNLSSSPGTFSGTKNLVDIRPGGIQTTASANNTKLIAVTGQASTSGDGGTSGHTVEGLAFQAGASGTQLANNETVTYSQVNAVNAQALFSHLALGGSNRALVVTTMRSIWANKSILSVGGTAGSDITQYYGVDVQAAGNSVVTNFTGVNIQNESSATGNVYGLYTDMVGTYAIFVDAGLSRFDGNGTHVFELPADATDPTGGGGAAAGRIPVTIGGATKYLAYY